MLFHYLATPYTDYPHGRENAFRAACRAAACLTEIGVPVYSPIAHWHPISLFMGDRPAKFWIELDMPYMKMAQGLIVVQLPGWDKSAGIFHERTIFERMGKPIKFLSWPTVPDRSFIVAAS